MTVTSMGMVPLNNKENTYTRATETHNPSRKTQLEWESILEGGSPSQIQFTVVDTHMQRGLCLLSVIRRIQRERNVSHLPRRVQQNKTRQVETHVGVDGKTVVFSHC